MLLRTPTANSAIHKIMIGIFTRVAVATALMIVSAFACMLGCYEVQKRKNAIVDSNGVKNLDPKPASGRLWAESLQIASKLSLKEKIMFVVVLAAVWLAVFRFLGLVQHIVTAIRVLSSLGFVLFAGVVDFYTKKIPNIVSALMCAISVIVFIAEAIWFQDYFKIAVVSCLIAAVVCFVFLILVYLICRGGFGMGDVKLICSMIILSGVAISVYSVFAGLLICLAVTVVLLITKKKGIKDELPFGPFIFLGYIISLILGGF